MFVTRKSISVKEFVDQKPDASCGAMSFFVGTVRDHHQGRSVKKLFYECYELMANQQFGLIIDQVKKQYSVFSVNLIHRVGWLEVGDVAIIIQVSSAHRDAAFCACRMVIDEIKKKVPIWKKEIYMDETSCWVGPSSGLKSDLS